MYLASDFGEEEKVKKNGLTLLNLESMQCYTNVKKRDVLCETSIFDQFCWQVCVGDASQNHVIDISCIYAFSFKNVWFQMLTKKMLLLLFFVFQFVTLYISCIINRPPTVHRPFFNLCDVLLFCLFLLQICH